MKELWQILTHDDEDGSKYTFKDFLITAAICIGLMLVCSIG
jgi:hypothetical protein